MNPKPVVMKKFFFGLASGICLFLFSFNGNAQKISLGINGGISIPELSSSGNNEVSEGYTSRYGPAFGIFADWGIGKNFSIRTQVDYASQGGKRNGMQPVTDPPEQLSQMLPPGTRLYANFRNEAILNYLEIPVMLKMRIGEGTGKFNYYVDLGPYIGFLLNAHQKTSGTSQFYLDKAGTMPLTVQGQPLPAQSFDANTDVKDDLKSSNFGITGGGGITYALTKKQHLVLDARGALGFTVIQKDTQANGKSHTGGLFVTLGYTIDL